MAVDSPHQLRVAQDVTPVLTEDAQLRPMAMRAKEMLGVEQMRAVADMGDDHGHAINAWAEAGMAACGPTPSTSANPTRGLFGQERCSDEPQQDGYRCPAGAALTCRCETTALGRHLRYDATAACRSCPLQEPCTSNNDGRRMTRWVDEHILERMEERLNATPASMPARKPLVAHPFGTLKHANDQGDVLMQGLKNGRAEFRLACLAYHRKRVLTILGVPRLLGALS
jgi:hypothetical protein